MLGQAQDVRLTETLRLARELHRRVQHGALTRAQIGATVVDRDLIAQRGLPEKIRSKAPCATTQ
jgi:hypothetical protein